MIISVWRLIICHIMIYQLSTYYFIIFYIHTSLSGPSRSFYTNNNATSMVATTTFPGWPNGAPGHALQQLVHPLIGFGQGISFAGQSLCGKWGRYRKLPMSAICRMQIFLLFTHTGKVLQGLHNNKPFKEVNQTILQIIGIRIQDPMFFSNYLPAAGWTSVFPVGAQHNQKSTSDPNWSSSKSSNADSTWPTCSRAHLQLLAHGVEGVPLVHETPQQVRDLPRPLEPLEPLEPSEPQQLGCWDGVTLKA